MSKSIRIGTRDSQLATWQAETVSNKLNHAGHSTEIIFVKSEGDLDLITPLPKMGGKGVFTKALDDALLNDAIDIAVHSFKDLPTENPLPLEVAAVLEREDARDSLVAPNGTNFLDNEVIEAIIATSSNRRKAQWLHRYPNHRIVNIRGNVNTRLKKVEDNEWNGAIFAAAGLKRIDLQHHISEYLDWMVPAPAQGAMAIMIRENDKKIKSIVAKLNHPETNLCTGIERELLNEMEAGCSAPVGAIAWIDGNDIVLQAVALEMDGTLQYDIERRTPSNQAKGLGRKAARELLEQGADKLVQKVNE